MVEQSRMHLQEGHLSVMWKDTTFNYSYFLWFEDNSVCEKFYLSMYINLCISIYVYKYIFVLYFFQGCSPPKCKVYLNYIMKNFPVPGILCGDYYR